MITKSDSCTHGLLYCKRYAFWYKISRLKSKSLTTSLLRICHFLTENNISHSECILWLRKIESSILKRTLAYARYCSAWSLEFKSCLFNIEKTTPALKTKVAY